MIYTLKYYYIVNGDSGYCTSPRPESTQSTISSMSNVSSSTKMQNGHSSLNDEANKKEDPQDERVPCEFCGDLRVKETIMRHQVNNLYIKNK